MVVAADDVPQYVRGDQMRIKQILVNLTSNAEKFTDKGFVSISVTVTNRFTDAETNKQMVSIVECA